MKKILALILALAVILSLGACTGKTPDASKDPSKPSGSTAPDDSKQPTEETVLTIPSYMVGENVGAMYFEPAVARFNEKYAGTYVFGLGGKEA